MKLKTARKLPIILEDFIEHTPHLIKEKPEDVNMSAAGLVNTRILTGYVQKSPRSLDRFRGIYRIHPNLIKEKPKDDNM